MRAPAQLSQVTSRAVATGHTSSKPTQPLANNRPQAVAQRKLQAAASSRVPGRLGKGPVQRLAYELPAPNNFAIDTDNVDAAKAQIDVAWNTGGYTRLKNLYTALVAGADAQGVGNKAIRRYIEGFLTKRSTDDPSAGNDVAGLAFARIRFDLANKPGDAIGVADGRSLSGERLHASNVRKWQVGDQESLISWSALAKHLRGTLPAADYLQYGAMLLADGATDAAKRDAATARMESMSAGIQDGLAYLPPLPGVSYRTSTAQPGVYGGRVNVGDFLSDEAFWSTVPLRKPQTINNVAKEFGDAGTIAQPLVYYIITGSTGVFLPRFTNTEVEAREVLFRRQTSFEVTKITNYSETAIFVYLTENQTDQPTKNPFTGFANPVAAPVVAPAVAAPAI